MKNIRKEIKQSQKFFEAEFKKFVNKNKAITDNLKSAMNYCLFPGGKRIRPILLLESSKMLGINIRKAIPAAIAIELAHNYTLVHDDLPCMDDDKTRRGKPTCHIKFDEATALLAGNALLCLAFLALREIKDKKIYSKIVETLAQTLGSAGIIAGQDMDLRLAKKKNYKNKVDYLKTSLLFSVASGLGGIISNAGKRKTTALFLFGKHFGMAFQTYDDILDDEPCPDKHKRRNRLKNFLKKAKSDLDIFGQKADNLKYIMSMLFKY